MAASRRNVLVERAVNHALERVDYFIDGGGIVLPDAKYCRAAEQLLDKASASVKTATLFLLFYWLHQPDWDGHNVAKGWRGKYGDKLLCEQLTQRSITLHNRIKAYGENLGTKGDQGRADVSADARFGPFFQTVKDADIDNRRRLADYFAHKFAESRREDAPLPPVGDDVLTFVRAKMLFMSLLKLHSGGHVQQFLIAALLYEYRLRQGIEVRTHQVHASDQSDRTAGDIEEVLEGMVIRAYEVTMRPDYKNRLSGIRDKMDRFGLHKYVIIASDVNTDEELSSPARLALLVEPQGRDIAIVDIQDVLNYLAAELAATELRSAVNRAFDYLSNPRLSNRPDFKALYREAVRQWLDANTEE